MALDRLAVGAAGFLLLCLYACSAQSDDASGQNRLNLDWATDLPVEAESSLICAEATGYLDHARKQIQQDFQSLYRCIDRRVEQRDVGDCQRQIQILQQSLTLLDDANAQIVSVCP